MDGAADAHLSACGMAEPGAGGALGIHAFHSHDEAIDERADVSADAGGAGRGDARAGAMNTNPHPEERCEAMRLEG